MEVKLLTDAQREELPVVILRRNRFKNLISQCIKKKDTTFSNAIIISGKPGTGKTTLITEFLEELQADGEVSTYNRVSGHMTKVALFEYLKPQYDPDTKDQLPQIHLIDDCDCIYDPGCLEIMKSAFDTRSRHKTNRHVFYHSGVRNSSYKYTDFAIIITNCRFDNPSRDQQALLDRVHLFNIDMNYSDFIIFNTYLIEKYLNENEDNLPEDIIKSVAEFYSTYVTKWFDNNAFQKANVNFSIRLIRKFIDLMVLFGDDWQNYSVDFKKLNTYGA